MVSDDVTVVFVMVSVVDVVIVGVATEEVHIVVVMFSWPLDPVYVFKCSHHCLRLLPLIISRGVN